MRGSWVKALLAGKDSLVVDRPECLLVVMGRHSYSAMGMAFGFEEGIQLAWSYPEVVDSFEVDIVKCAEAGRPREAVKVQVAVAWILVEGTATLVVEAEDTSDYFHMAGW